MKKNELVRLYLYEIVNLYFRSSSYDSFLTALPSLEKWKEYSELLLYEFEAHRDISEKRRFYRCSMVVSKIQMREMGNLENGPQDRSKSMYRRRINRKAEEESDPVNGIRRVSNERRFSNDIQDRNGKNWRENDIREIFTVIICTKIKYSRRIFSFKIVQVL